MKCRLSALDISAVVLDLQCLVGMYLQSVYDTNSRTFLLKFSLPNRKEIVIVESGVRIHSTEYEREKPPRPSNFVMVLRKHLSNRRLTAVRQLNMDRVVVFDFCTYENVPKLNYQLYCEFYAAGNVILATEEQIVVTVLRQVDSGTESADEWQYRPGCPLKLHPPVVPPEYTFDSVKALIAEPEAKGKRLRVFLKSKLVFPMFVTDHAISATQGADPQALVSAESTELILQIISEAKTLMESFSGNEFATESSMPTSSSKRVPGYIILANKENPDAADRFVDLQPVLLAQYKDSPYREFDSFDRAADVYFSELESQRALDRIRQQDETAARKLQAIENEQAKRVEQLASDQIVAQARAAAVELNGDLVDAAIISINSALATGIDWQELVDLVEVEKSCGLNPVADIIENLELHTNRIFINLPSADDQSKLPQIPIDLGSTAMANARLLYTHKKKAYAKQIKTTNISKSALESASNSIRDAVSKRKMPVLQNSALTRIRRPLWFEKFHWFISSQGYLVVAGRDMQQNEILVKRYMEKRDIYVHADLHGAPSVIVKNEYAHFCDDENNDDNISQAPISDYPPPSTIEQAGCMAICLSKAWSSKIVTSAWWVYENQVSKSAPTGEYLTTGSFMIRGRKNYLPHSQLVYGVGVLFKVDNESAKRHYMDRMQKRQQQQQNMLQISEDNADNNENTVEDQSEVQETATRDFEEQSTGDLYIASQSIENSAEQPQSLAEQLEALLLEDSETQSSASSDSEENDNTKKSTPAAQKKHYSKAILKRLKKGLTLEEALSAAENAKECRSKAKLNQENAKTATNENADNNVRGKHGKKKKAQKKYGMQDEDERQIAMDLLKSNQGPQPKGKKEKLKAAKKREREEINLLREQARVNAQNSTTTVEPKLADIKELEDVKDIDASCEQDIEDISEAAEDLSRNLQSAIDSLVGQLNPEDVALFAVPVCAPYQALQGCKFRAKLTPGQMKKGKAAKLCVSTFNSIASENEKELISGITDSEWIAVLLGQVKVSSTLLTSIQKKKKK